MTEINGEAEPALNEVPLADQVVNTKVTWDDRKMVTTFANVVNVLATREEVTVLFGVCVVLLNQGSNEISRLAGA